jgi:hypothetical protein
MSETIPVKEISELIDMTTDKVPKMISGLLNTMYSAEAGANMGKAVGSLYKELVASGITSGIAMEMARDYMLSIKDIVSKAGNFSNAAQHSEASQDDDEDRSN